MLIKHNCIERSMRAGERVCLLLYCAGGGGGVMRVWYRISHHHHHHPIIIICSKMIKEELRKKRRRKKKKQPVRQAIVDACHASHYGECSKIRKENPLGGSFVFFFFYCVVVIILLVAVVCRTPLVRSFLFLLFPCSSFTRSSFLFLDKQNLFVTALVYNRRLCTEPMHPITNGSSSSQRRANWIEVKGYIL